MHPHRRQQKEPAPATTNPGCPRVTAVDWVWLVGNAAVHGFQTIRATASLVEALVAPPWVMK